VPCTPGSGCEAGGYGALACPDASWTAWFDGSWVEDGVNSCLLKLPSPRDWASANASCAAVAPGAHLATTRQVRSILWVGYGGLDGCVRGVGCVCGVWEYCVSVWGVLVWGVGCVALGVCCVIGVGGVGRFGWG
jgi:hypothetical protein